MTDETRVEHMQSLQSLARGLAAWDKKWPKGTILPARLERACNDELVVLCTLAATLANDPKPSGVDGDAPGHSAAQSPEPEGAGSVSNVQRQPNDTGESK